MTIEALRRLVDAFGRYHDALRRYQSPDKLGTIVVGDDLDALYGELEDAAREGKALLDRISSNEAKIGLQSYITSGFSRWLDEGQGAGYREPVEQDRDGSTSGSSKIASGEGGVKTQTGVLAMSYGKKSKGKGKKGGKK